MTAPTATLTWLPGLIGPARRRLVLRSVLVSVLSSLTLLLGAAVLLVAVDLLVGLSPELRRVLRYLPLCAALLPLAWKSRRLRLSPSDERVALYLEEREPALDNRLVTALSAGTKDTPAARALLRQVAGLREQLDVRRLTPMLPSVASLSLGAATLPTLALLLIYPGGGPALAGRWLSPSDHPLPPPVYPRDTVPGAEGGAAVFGEFRWTIRPPAYTRAPEYSVPGAGVLAALAGSRVRVEGVGFWPRLEVRLLDGRALPVEWRARSWHAAWTVRPGDRGLSFWAQGEGGAQARRVVPVSVTPDRPPEVTLHAPGEDMVLAAGRGTVHFRAGASDDHGVGSFALGWIRTRGSGESYSFEQGVTGWDRTRRGGGGSVTGEAAVALAGLDLHPGDVVHFRAVARDRNTVTGPGEGVSETRVIRVAREDELYTVTTLIGAPLELEQDPILSQRTLIIMTEELRDRVAETPPAEVLEEAGDIAALQRRLRTRVGDQIFTRVTPGIQPRDLEIGFQDEHQPGGHDHGAEEQDHEPGQEDQEDRREEVLEEASAATGTGRPEEYAHRHDEAPIIAVDHPLLDAYNAMWAAERELNQGSPAQAIPHQYRALEIIIESRDAERVYARGEVTAPVVDVPETRGTGETDGVSPARRRPLRPAAGVGPDSWLAGVENRLSTLSPSEGSRLLSEQAARLLKQGADPNAAALVSRAGEEAARGRLDAASRLLARARVLLSPAGRGGAEPVRAASGPASARYFRLLAGETP
ncbi:MAG: DUF4175 family protein [Longimicrobiaceae bacterium]